MSGEVLLSRDRVIGRPACAGGKAREETASGTGPGILAIGASTGGPRGVMTLLRTLPADFPAAVFVVQHIAEGFAQGFAAWLAAECALPVGIAVEGAACRPGEVVVAPGSSHLTLAGERIALRDDPPVNCCRPSIDVFFSSLAQAPCDRVVALLLSGMGKDGALGMLRIRERGGTTLVQDEPTCAVFGMPREAIRLDAVDLVLPLDDIPAAIVRLFPRRPPPAEAGREGDR